MSAKDIIKSFFNKNTYINDWFYKTLSKDKTSEVLKIYKEMEQWDTIRDISELKKFRTEIEEGRIYYTTDPNLSNGRIYGIWESIFGNCYDDIVKSPAVEHGLIFHNQVFTDLKYTARSTLVTFGNFRKNIIHQYIKRPVFTVGPYIHYANSFYDFEEQQKLKERLGKTLLVFPTHSTNTSKLSIKEQEFLDVIKRLAMSYNSVVINAFWWNINDSLIRAFESEGYYVVSAGYRDDNKFLSRLKSIINLADLVVGDSIGTHVGYCISENIPFKFLNLETRVSLLDKNEQKDISFVSNNLDKIKLAFKGSSNKGITEVQRDVCEEFWGFQHKKNSKEIQLICEINDELRQLTKGNVFLCNMMSKHLLERYKERSSEKYLLLKDAMQ